MNLPPLPEMPEPDDTDDCTYAAHSGNQMEAYAREYGESCARMAREEAAKIVETASFGKWDVETMGDLREALAAAIRKG